MAYRTPQKQREAQARYRQTPAGRAASRRSHQRYIEKRRARSDSPALQIDPEPLAQVLTAWRAQ